MTCRFFRFLQHGTNKDPSLWWYKKTGIFRNKGQTIVHNILLSCNSASTPKSEELKWPKMASVCQSRRLKAVFLKLFPELAFKLIASVQTLLVIWVWNWNQILLSTAFFTFKNVSSTFDHSSLFKSVAQSLGTLRLVRPNS